MKSGSDRAAGIGGVLKLGKVSQIGVKIPVAVVMSGDGAEPVGAELVGLFRRSRRLRRVPERARRG